jgi:hypothetical protein
MRSHLNKEKTMRALRRCFMMLLVYGTGLIVAACSDPVSPESRLRPAFELVYVNQTACTSTYATNIADRDDGSLHIGNVPYGNWVQNATKLGDGDYPATSNYYFEVCSDESYYYDENTCRLYGYDCQPATIPTQQELLDYGWYSGGGSAGPPAETPRWTLKVSDCNYDLVNDTSGVWVRDSLKVCQRPFIPQEKAQILIAMDTLRRPATSFTNDTARMDCDSLFAKLTLALQDTTFGLGRHDTNHQGSAGLNTFYGHVDPRVMGNTFFPTRPPTPRNVWDHSYALLLTNALHEVGHAYGGWNHPKSETGGSGVPYAGEYFRWLNFPGAPNSCVM